MYILSSHSKSLKSHCNISTYNFQENIEMVYNIFPCFQMCNSSSTDTHINRETHDSRGPYNDDHKCHNTCIRHWNIYWLTGGMGEGAKHFHKKLVPLPANNPQMQLYISLKSSLLLTCIEKGLISIIKTMGDGWVTHSNYFRWYACECVIYPYPVPPSHQK